MFERQSLYDNCLPLKMDSRIIWTAFIMCIVGTTCGTLEHRNMNDCWKAGLNCSRWGKCNFDTSSSNFTCRCVLGYKGDLCEDDINECDIGIAPCKKRGVCHNSVGSFRCDCFQGWQGSHCQTSDGTGLSTCPTGYAGVKYMDDFDECTQWAENPCEHNSTCIYVPGNFSCSCMTGWKGRICNEDINECNHTSVLCHNGGNCTNTPGAYTCVCPYPHMGSACDDMSSTHSTTTATTTTSQTTLLQPFSISWAGVSILNTPTTTSATSSTLSTKSSTFVITSVSVSNSSPVTNSSSSPTNNDVATNSYFTTMTRQTASYDHTTTSSASFSSTNSYTRQLVTECNTSGGVGNVGTFAGLIVGILVIAGAFGAGLVFFVYKIFYRKSHKIDAGDETEVETTKQYSTTGDSNKNTKWKPKTEDPNMNVDQATTSV